MKNYEGNRLYRDWEKGKKLTHKQAIFAHCAECMGFYSDGRQDCCGNNCPLYDLRPVASRDSRTQKRIKNDLYRDWKKSS